MVEVKLLLHEGNWEIDTDKAAQIKQTIRENIVNNDKDIKVYLMAGNKQTYETHQDAIGVFINAVMNCDTTETEEVIEVNGNTYSFDKVYFATRHETRYKLIKSEDGNVLGYFDTKFNDFYVNKNALALDKEDRVQFIIDAVLEFDKQYIIKDPNSFLNEDAREHLIKGIMDNATASLKNEISLMEQRIKDREYTIKDARDRIFSATRALLEERVKLEQMKENGNSGVGKKIVDELELIANDERVTDVIIEGKKVTVSVPKVYAYAEISGEERKFYIGNMKIKFDLENSEVKFFGDNGRQGYWTEEDPHPHVDGSTGNPCLGNTSAMIAELGAEREYYALFITALNFLESVNTDDVAGRRVRNWDAVDEGGNIIDLPPLYVCESCGDEIDEDDEYSRTVYTYYDGGGEVSGEETWCEGCVDGDAYWNEHIGEHVTSSVNDDVNVYYDEDDDEDEEDEF